MLALKRIAVRLLARDMCRNDAGRPGHVRMQWPFQRFAQIARLPREEGLGRNPLRTRVMKEPVDGLQIAPEAQRKLAGGEASPRAQPPDPEKQKSRPGGATEP